MSESFGETIVIQGQLMAQKNVCKFTVSHPPVYMQGRAHCSSAAMAGSSPLLQALFELEGVRQVMVTEKSFTIEKTGEEPWPALGKKIGALIRSHAKPDTPLIADDEVHPAPNVRDGVIQRQVFDLIKTDINPLIASHGGFVDLDKVQNGVVYLKMGGGCQGCSAASMTLKMSIERIIYENVPEVNDIVDVTNHDAGANPYYTSGTGHYGS